MSGMSPARQDPTINKRILMYRENLHARWAVQVANRIANSQSVLTISLIDHLVQIAIRPHHLPSPSPPYWRGMDAAPAKTSMP